MRIFKVIIRDPYDEFSDGRCDDIFTTRKLAQRYIDDWPYRNDWDIEEVEVRNTYEESYDN